MAKTLLIVEDDPYVVRLYERLFSFKNYTVAIASNGQECLDKAEEIKPDLILLDIMMPVMNGLQALEKLRANQDTKNTPIIMLTNIDEQADIQKAMRLGATTYLVKSDFTPEQVLDQVVKYLG